MIRLGLIGCGAWGWRYVPAARESGVAHVTHVASAVAGLALATPHLHGLTRVASRDWRSLLDAPVDAFIVATPPDTHEEICTELLHAGRPVMVEKPIALSVRAATAIVEASQKTGATLLVNHQHLFAPAYEALRDRITEPCELLSCAGNVGPFRSYYALWDYGPHDIAMILGLTYGPSSLLTASRGDDTFRMRLSAGDHVARVSVWNDHLPKTRRFVALRRGWSAEYDALATRGNLLRVNDEPIAVDPEQPLQRAVRLFAEAVRSGTTDWRFGGVIPMGVTRLLEAAERLTQQQ